jgi:hypothetical protein
VAVITLVSPIAVATLSSFVMIVVMATTQV